MSRVTLSTIRFNRSQRMTPLFRTGFFRRPSTQYVITRSRAGGVHSVRLITDDRCYFRGLHTRFFATMTFVSVGTRFYYLVMNNALIRDLGTRPDASFPVLFGGPSQSMTKQVIRRPTRFLFSNRQFRVNHRRPTKSYLVMSDSSIFRVIRDYVSVYGNRFCSSGGRGFATRLLRKLCTVLPI